MASTTIHKVGKRLFELRAADGTVLCRGTLQDCMATATDGSDQ